MIDVTRTARQVGIVSGTVCMTAELHRRHVRRKPGGADGRWDQNRCATGVESHAQASTILRRMVYELLDRLGCTTMRGFEMEYVLLDHLETRSHMESLRFGVVLVTGRRKRECVPMVATYKDRDIVIGLAGEG